MSERLAEEKERGGKCYQNDTGLHGSYDPAVRLSRLWRVLYGKRGEQLFSCIRLHVNKQVLAGSELVEQLALNAGQQFRDFVSADCAKDRPGNTARHQEENYQRNGFMDHTFTLENQLICKWDQDFASVITLNGENC
ncbi:MAG TPA: hypothetical protein VD837_14835 [Terriglobales bacterium]|nr:hypothetical protein [Terriglobales bacterium]